MPNTLMHYMYRRTGSYGLILVLRIRIHEVVNDSPPTAPSTALSFDQKLIAIYVESSQNAVDRGYTRISRDRILNLKAPLLHQREKMNAVFLPASHHSFFIVNDHNSPILNQ